MQTKTLILSGPTHEYIDPVRFIGNASSGRMGKALAEEAMTRGHAIDFVSGPVCETNLPELAQRGIIHQVISAREMLEAALRLAPGADTIIFAAAVADYAPAARSPEKRAKSADEIVLQLRATPDIAQIVCRDKRAGQVAIGFALQTDDGELNARRKLDGKNLDGIVLNTPATLGASTGTFSFLKRGAENFDSWGCIDKHACAQRIFDAIEHLHPR